MLHVDDCLYHSVYFRIVLIATLLVWRQIIFFISHTTVPLFCNDLKSPPSSPGLSWPFAIFEKAFDRITASLISRVREEQNSMRELARLGWSHEASFILHTNYYTPPPTPLPFPTTTLACTSLYCLCRRPRYLTLTHNDVIVYDSVQ